MKEGQAKERRGYLLDGGRGVGKEAHLMVAEKWKTYERSRAENKCK